MRSAFSAFLLAGSSALSAQDTFFAPRDSLGTHGRVVQEWIALRVAPGREAHALEHISELTRGTNNEWRRSALGSLVLTQGEGSPHRVLACGIDEPSYVVSHITPDGYLRAHTSGSRARHPMTAAMHVGQRIIVLASDASDDEGVRVVPGVFAVRSTHLQRGRPGPAWGPETLGMEDLWIDVGARSSAEVASLGVKLMDPVFRDAPDWSVGDAVVGPAAAARAGCAAVAAAAIRAPAGGRTTFVISTQSSFNWTGLHGVLTTLGEIDSLYVVHPSAADAGNGRRDPLARLRLPTVRWAGGIAAAARYAATAVEALSEAEIGALFNDVARAAGIAGTVDPRDALLSAGPLRSPQPADSLSRYSELLARLTDVYAVSGDEAPIRQVVRARLPEWARDSVVSDSAGNLILAMGPDRDTVVFVAHMDEVGFEVVRAENGIATLRQAGGFYPWLYAGQAALLHLSVGEDERAQGCRPTSGKALRGVFLLSDSTRDSRELRAWFGDDLTTSGPVAGARVTGFKCSTRLGKTRFSARGIDDRLGTAALVLALEGITPSRLSNKVIFVWTVREETSLGGARVVAEAFGPTVKRVYNVDTFVSADSPLETERLAVTPIGEGAVIRALDNLSVTTAEDIERVQSVARRGRIPLQVGTTGGGTDGSAFAAFGADYVGIGWPLRYSHSPVEVIDLRDMRSLVRLITALALTPFE